MLNAARWTVFGLLAASLLILAATLGYVLRGGGDDRAGLSRAGNGASPSLEELDFSQLNQILELLGKHYVDPDRVDAQTLYQAAIDGMLEVLTDAGTYYIDPITVATRPVDLSGTFQGIGATVTEENGQVVIVAPIEGTPAERAGIRPGDIVLEVDGQSTDGWNTEQAVLRIRGPRGSKVTLKVRHDDGTEEVLEITRDEIEVDSVTTQPPGGALEDGTGTAIDDVAYIHIRTFTALTTDQFLRALDDIVTPGTRGLVLDLRNNTGGLLSTTIEVADEFLEDGTVLSERARDGSETSYSARRGGAAIDIPLVVLMNRFSASGSEVLAAALHDNGRATLVGEKSYGKGTVNISNNLQDGGELYVTVARWFTPDGTLIDDVGIRPDVEVTLSDEDIDLRRDVQLMKAIDIIRGTNTVVIPTPTPGVASPEATGTPEAGG